MEAGRGGVPEAIPMPLVVRARVEYHVGKEVSGSQLSGGAGMENFYDWVISRGERVVAPLVGYPGVRFIASSVHRALHDPAVQLEALGALRQRLAPDIIFTLLDLTVEAEALGLEVEFSEKNPPRLADQELPKLERFMEMDIPDPERSARMPVFLQVAEELKGEGRALVGACVTGPLTLLAQLVRGMDFLKRSKTGGRLKEAMGFTTSVVGAYAAALASRSDVVLVVDPAAEVLDAEKFRLIYQPFIKALFGIIRSGGAAGLLHICGDTTPLVEELGVCGAEGVLFEAVVDLPRVAQRMPQNVVVMGNLDPKRVLRRGTPDDVRWEVRRLIRNMRGVRNFVVSSGCDVPADAPMRNLEAMMEEARSWKPRYG